MVEYNDYKTTAQGLYGNGTETIFINQHGKAFVVQSPDLVNTGRDAVPTDNFLPADMVQLGTAAVSDLVIPEWVYEAQ